MALNKRIVIFM